ncbi:heat-shock protein Hsp20 [Burkholderia sp. SG-MS1]|uniref:Hsp20/alpha crystallin family protein n=1 Tax=Paraburkholderia sp. SG-MS1 TaxID=2023741 RepID=UPI0014461DC5|nr:Hsp20/alpha crystallin family protein [Paraburkholderia sp. SG-MS1]NKJ49265.1 heat-shock protein Hsp20 [Paraburkholderia sp. SG-MS1]
MSLDLDKWNPFRFLRHSADEKQRQASSGVPQQPQQQGSPRTADASHSGAAALPSLWGADPARWPLADPFRLFTDLVRDPFGGLGPLEQWFGDFSPSRFQPRLDVVDDGDALRIVAELPGLSRDEVKLEIVENMLLLSGNKQIESKEEEKGCYRVERAFGQFQRAIPLPAGVDPDRAEARFENGVLTVRMPKAQQVQQSTKQIEIK